MNLWVKREGLCGDEAVFAYDFREASPADLVAAVRRGVESGTIKGEVLDVEIHGEWIEGRLGDFPSHDVIGHTDHSPGFKPGTYLVIPVSDGGSET